MTDLFEAETTTTTSLDLRRLQRLKRRATRRKWTLVFVTVGLVIVAIGGSVAYNFVTTSFATTDNSALDYEGLGQGNVTVVIDRGATGADIATALFEAGVVGSEQAFLKEYKANSGSSGILPGHYYMQREMKAEYALERLLDPANRELYKITIPEGKKLDFYYQQIANVTGATVAEVEAAAEDTEALGLPAEAGGNLEGWLFPSTYSFDPGVTPTAVLQEMVRLTISTLDSVGVAPADRQRILTIASLVEKEAKLPEDRPMIAGVIYNRLNKDWALELDSAVKYAVPTSTGSFATAEELKVDSPYNLHLHKGLPPGPIAAPGKASIEAAVAPAVHDYMFFVTVNLDTGETAYGATVQEHDANVQKLRDWMAANGKS